MRISRLLAAGASAAIVASSALVCSAPPAAADDDTINVVGAACANGQGVTVVVDFTPVVQTIDIRCATPTATMTIGDAFTAAGFQVEAPGGFVTTIDGVTADFNSATAPAYWSLYTSTDNGQPSGAPASEWVSGMAAVTDGPVTAGQAYLYEYLPLDPSDTWNPLKTSPLVPLSQLLSESTTAAPATPPPAYGPGPADAQAAAGWLGRQLAANKDVLPYDGATDWGLTTDAVLGLASAGVGGDQIAATAAKLAASGNTYVGTTAQATANAGKTAKAVFTLEVAGLDPTKFGTRDLVAELRSAVAGSGQIGTPASTWNQALGLLALARSAGGAPADAVTWLQAYQCSSGANAGAYGWSAGCDSADQDITALVAQALLAAGVPATDPSVKNAASWLLTKQEKSGGFESSWGGTNTNTTGLAAQLFRGLGGNTGAVTKARGYIGGLQVSGDLIAANKKLKAADEGAIAFDAAGLSDATTYGIDSAAIDQFRRTTTQAVLGLGGPVMGELTATGAQAALPKATYKPATATPSAKPSTSGKSTTGKSTKPAKTTTGSKAPSIETGGTVTGGPAPALAVVFLVLAAAVPVIRFYVGRRSA